MVVLSNRIRSFRFLRSVVFYEHTNLWDLGWRALFKSKGSCWSFLISYSLILSMEDYLGLLVSISDGLSFPKKKLFLSVGDGVTGRDHCS